MLSEYLCVFLKYKNMDIQNGHSKKWINMYPQNVLSESPRRKEGCNNAT